MKVLLDHNMPHSLRPLLADDNEVYTTAYLGWSDLEDDRLLQAAVEASFAALVTLDRSLPHQQETRTYDLGIVVLTVHPITPAHLKTHMDRLRTALPRAASEQTLMIDRLVSRPTATRSLLHRAVPTRSRPTASGGVRRPDGIR